MVSPLFSVIIPVFNKWDLTANCLRSLREHTPGDDFEVIVADNASTDETAVGLLPLGRELFGERFTRLRFEANRNFGPACNAGARAAAAPLLFFLNNDTVLTQGWAPPLLKALAEETALGAVGPLLLYGDGTVQHLGVAVGSTGVLHLYRRFPADHPVAQKRRYCQMLTAAALMLPRGLFFDCGGFYEGYINGFEDIELSVRIGQRGARLLCVPESRVFHLESQTPGRKHSESHNSDLLTRRCGDLLHTDLHRHGLADGFDVFVDDFFEVSLRLRPEEEEALVQAARDQPVPFWLELVRRHPFWIRGREILADALEKQGQLEGALLFRASIADALSSEDAYRRLMRIAAQARNTVIFNQAKKYFDVIARHKRDRQSAERAMNKALRRLPASGEEELEAMFRAKFAPMHP